MANRTISNTFSLLLICCGSVASVHAQDIQWRTSEPFPFIRSSSIIEELRSAFDESKSTIGNRALALERILQDKFAGGASVGWFSKLAEDGHKATCWDSRNLQIRSECRNYLNEGEYLIEAWLTRGEYLQGKSCEWSVNSSLPQTVPCDARVKLSFPRYESSSVDKSYTLSVRFDDHTLSIPAKITDLLVVGLGDSFGSGEGNPDIPIRIAEAGYPNTLNTKIYPDGLPILPKREKPKSPQWLDTRCHRSLYSYQFKTALQMALEQPHSVVRFISLACSAAEIAHVFDKSQKGWDLKEHAEPKWDGKKITAELRSVEPQVHALKKLICPTQKLKKNQLCSHKPIDLLLLSIGGNDSGFGKFVAGVIFAEKHHWPWLARALRLFGIAQDPHPDKTPATIQDLALRFGKLNDSLLNNLRIASCEGSIDSKCERVLLTAYPPPYRDESGELCKADRAEFDIPFGWDPERGVRLSKTEKFVYDGLITLQRNVASKHGWRLVDGHLGLFRTRGFCASNSGYSQINTVENLSIPYRTVKNEVVIWRTLNWRTSCLEEFSLSSFRAYASRARWFRLPIDARLAIGQDFGLFGIEKDFPYLDETAGIMHPTAEGSAAMADANLIVISQMPLLP